MKASRIAQLSTLRPFLGSRSFLLPKRVDLIAGQEYSFYWKGLTFLPSLTGYTFNHTGPGTSDTIRWTWTPTVGTYKLILRAYFNGVLVGRAITKLYVHSSTGHSGICRLNLIGDSNTASNSIDSYPNTISRLLNNAGLSLTMHGSHTAALADPGVNEEGRPGRTAAFFMGDFIDPMDPSPFAAGGAAYVTTYGSGVPFTDVAIVLGTNDNDLVNIENQFESLLQIILDGSPNCRRYVVLTINVSDEADDWGTPGTTELANFEAKRKSIIEILYNAFNNRESEKIYLVTAHGALNPSSDFDDNNVHPNNGGLPKIGRFLAGAFMRHYISA